LVFVVAPAAVNEGGLGGASKIWFWFGGDVLPSNPSRCPVTGLFLWIWRDGEGFLTTETVAPVGAKGSDATGQEAAVCWGIAETDMGWECFSGSGGPFILLVVLMLVLLVTLLLFVLLVELLLPVLFVLIDLLVVAVVPLPLLGAFLVVAAG
jgi:hypothetical protein